MEFVQKFTPPDFKVKNFTPSISPYFNSFSGKKHKKWVKMEKFTPLAKILHCRRHWRHGQIPPLIVWYTISYLQYSHVSSQSQFLVQTPFILPHTYCLGPYITLSWSSEIIQARGGYSCILKKTEYLPTVSYHHNIKTIEQYSVGMLGIYPEAYAVSCPK